ncbi:MAG: serine hydrolase domain-containing protein [Microcella sp.]|uniref:serine hydrolase domain-containing protein n=1 Tax=Microcella sp. TaxID=1913979 RepID=UPI003315BF23
MPLIVAALIATAILVPADTIAVAPATALPVVASNAVDDAVDRELPAAGAPGVAYAVVRDGEVVEAGARGLLRLGEDEPMTEDTPFVIGSISKSFTALAVMQLVEEGQVDLDAPIGTYLPAFNDGPGSAITVRDLLGHTSGYSTLQGNAVHGDNNGEADDLARAVDAIAVIRPARTPGTQWEYSNTNYQVLGRLIETVGGQPYASYLQKHVLDPIGMTDSTVAGGAQATGEAVGHVPWFATRLPVDQRSPDPITAPQGGVIASAHDVALYLGVLMNGKDDVLSAEGKSQMLSPANPSVPFYGLGWYLDGAGTAWHSGATPGIETLATMNPADRVGVVVLVNAGSGIGFGETTQLRNAVTAAALELDYSGEGARWSQQLLYLGLILLPLTYLLAGAWAFLRRDRLRAKREDGFSGWFSLLFPILTTAVAAWVFLGLMPQLFGAPLATVALFQPDVALLVVTAAVTGVLWSALRLVVALSGPRVVKAGPGRWETSSESRPVTP